MRPKQILAFGGGGFLMEKSPVLDDAVLAATGVDRPRVLFIGTAGGDWSEHLVKFYAAFAGKAEARHLALFKRTVGDLRSFVMDHDAVYVGGGNTVSMLAVWRTHGLDAVLREAYAAGVVMSGMSAGAVCWFEGTVTDSYGPTLQTMRDGLGVMPGWFVPHYDSEDDRRPALHARIASGECPGAWAVDDGAGLWFRDGAVHEVVRSRPAANAFRVEREGDTIVERMVRRSDDAA